MTENTYARVKTYMEKYEMIKAHDLVAAGVSGGADSVCLLHILRRLQKEECLEAYDREFAGRNRRYYKITDKGRAQLRLYREEWISYSSKITRIFSEVKC